MYRSQPYQPYYVDARALRAAIGRVLRHYTRAGLLFTSLDVSNAVKHSMPAARHRDIAPLVRARFLRGEMGEYARTLIEVLAGGTTPAAAFLYHPPGSPTDFYDDAMRSQLATPPANECSEEARAW
ncbi:MAG: hypothetical protein MUF34_29155 [Polyangiaceae bacterium]|jgi:hypothetical protein|nr:hypothetical protein [Polyangiaceae bacterium]